MKDVFQACPIYSPMCRCWAARQLARPYYFANDRVQPRDAQWFSACQAYIPVNTPFKVPKLSSPARHGPQLRPIRNFAPCRDEAAVNDDWNDILTRAVGEIPPLFDLGTSVDPNDTSQYRSLIEMALAGQNQSEQEPLTDQNPVSQQPVMPPNQSSQGLLGSEDLLTETPTRHQAPPPHRLPKDQDSAPPKSTTVGDQTPQKPLTNEDAPVQKSQTNSREDTGNRSGISEEEQLIIKQLVQEQMALGNYTEEKWLRISRELQTKFHIHRGFLSIKNFWNRHGRDKFGLDERKKPNPGKMVTGKQDPVERKKAREDQKKRKRREMVDQDSEKTPSRIGSDGISTEDEDGDAQELKKIKSGLFVE
ncbi:MAG: hypothetical protein Q9190_004676 [Brigantiaea leucoxantha]